MERRFKRALSSLDGIFEFTAAFVAAESIPEAEAFALNFVLEELFTNMIKYQPRGGEEVLVSITRDGPSLVVRLKEFDVDYFDITRVAEADIERPLQERSPGGLGLYLVRKIVDEVVYAYSGRQSVVTLVKHMKA